MDSILGRLSPAIFATLAILLSVTLLAGAAAAQSRTVSDPHDDGRWGDFGELYGLDVNYARKELGVSTRFATATDVHEFQVRVSGMKGWQFVLVWQTEEDTEESFTYIQVFTRQGYKEYDARCVLTTAKFAGWDAHEMSFTVPLRCLKIDGKAPKRISVREQVITLAADFEGPTDTTAWTAWAKRG